ncbi:MAG: hypothetical protein ACK4MD_03115 [Demequina sp.]
MPGRTDQSSGLMVWARLHSIDRALPIAVALGVGGWIAAGQVIPVPALDAGVPVRWLFGVVGAALAVGIVHTHFEALRGTLLREARERAATWATSVAIAAMTYLPAALVGAPLGEMLSWLILLAATWLMAAHDSSRGLVWLVGVLVGLGIEITDHRLHGVPRQFLQYHVTAVIVASVAALWYSTWAYIRR